MTDVKKTLAAYAASAENALADYLPESEESYRTLIDAMRYSLLGGGKRIRAALCQEFCRVCSGDPKDALPFACAVEMIHAYSLIHDDLPCMDNDDMRRGKASCHIAFEESTAMLAGDALQALAFETALSADRNKISAENIINAARALAYGAGCEGMCAGQALDLAAEGETIRAKQLGEIQQYKTGALIIAACVMGCYAAGASDEQIKAAGIYASNIGAAFQMIDDVLDVIADESELGKPVGSDEENHKTTYVTLFGIEKTIELARGLTEQAKEALGIFGQEADFLKDLADFLATRKK